MNLYLIYIYILSTAELSLNCYFILEHSGSSDGKESICLQFGRPGLDPWLGKSPGEENGSPIHFKMYWEAFKKKRKVNETCNFNVKVYFPLPKSE